MLVEHLQRSTDPCSWDHIVVIKKFWSNLHSTNLHNAYNTPCAVLYLQTLVGHLLHNHKHSSRSTAEVPKSKRQPRVSAATSWNSICPTRCYAFSSGRWNLITDDSGSLNCSLLDMHAAAVWILVLGFTIRRLHCVFGVPSLSTYVLFMRVMVSK